MKTKEFIEKVENLGYTVKEGYVGADLLVLKDGYVVLIVCTKNRFTINTDISEFRLLDDIDKEKLLNIVLEYAKTPIEEREEPKKYYLRLPDIVSPGWSYLNLWVAKDIYYFSCSDEMSGKYKTKFTQEEIDNLPNQDFIKTLIKEEVQDV